MPHPDLLPHLDVRKTHDPRSQLPSKTQGVQDDERRVSKPLQHRGAHTRDAQGVERVSSGTGKKNRAGAQRAQRARAAQSKKSKASKST